MNASDAALNRCATLAATALGGSDPGRIADLALYLAHVEEATPLRRLARAAGKAPSSVHRAVRRVEAMRDDPLLDRAVDAAGAVVRAEPSAEAAPPARDPALFERVALRALEKLAEADAFLMVAAGAGKAGVFSRRNRFRRPLGLLSVADAVDMAARDWIRCVSRTEASAKYAITAAGRARARRARAEDEAMAAGGECAPSPFAEQHRPTGPRAIPGPGGAPRTVRAVLAESPLAWLSRRRGGDGAAFLDPAEVEAGERLREDWETAQIGPRVAQDWTAFLTPRDGAGRGAAPAEGPAAARERVSRAFSQLGPGLADVALRSCCLLEGLEETERRMGWSARSGKVVLKIALQRLAAHYGIPQRPPGRPG